MKRFVFPVLLGFLVFIVSFQLLDDEPLEEARVLSSSQESQTTPTETQENPEPEPVYSDTKDSIETTPLKKNYTSGTFVENDEAKGITPVRMEIPSIEVDAPIQPQGYTKDGGMAVPDSVTDVGWFEPGTKPGKTGNSVIAGHVDGQYGPAVFYDLKKLKAGDEILVHGKDGKMLTFTVQEVVAYPVDEAPLRKLFGPTNERSLNLITCTGPYDNEAQGYTERLAVYTVLKEQK
ncbi:class F sortase [Halobacillus mangrovi]|uniref:Peptidase C60 sortase A and B n=1 Tax=Halobacillus mangrovi TaxID=402384 RepID=A0A1W5ZYD5_9BACI|nr:class F sortase [Halobacillus mangrovi]ARI78279.1 peptidase C60 sortase A and B [Halobacillus mangrovi]